MRLRFIYMFRNVINDHARLCVFYGIVISSPSQASHTIESRAYSSGSYVLNLRYRISCLANTRYALLPTSVYRSRWLVDGAVRRSDHLPQRKLPSPR